MRYPLYEKATNTWPQLCFVTDDLDKANEWWSNMTGLPLADVWTSAPQVVAQAQYRGRPTQAGMRQVLYRFKGTWIEIVEPDETPSAWREWLDTHGPGFHHVGFRVPDLDKATTSLAEEGYELIQIGNIPTPEFLDQSDDGADSGPKTAGRYAYCDTEVDGHFIVELLEFQPELIGWLESKFPLT